MNLISNLFRQSWPLLLLAVVTSILCGISNTAIVAIIAKAIAGKASHVVLAWAFFGSCVTMILSMAISRITLVKMTQSEIFKLRVELCYKLLATPLKKQMELGNNDVLLILTRDINVFVDSLPLGPALIANSVVIVCCVAYVGWLSWQLFIVFAGVTAIGMFVFHQTRQRPLAKLVTVEEHAKSLYYYLRNLIDGSKELRLNAERGELFVEKVIVPKAQEFRTTYDEFVTEFAWVSQTGAGTFYIVIGVMLFAIPAWSPQSMEALATVTLVVMYLIRPITDMMNALPGIKQAAIALKNIRKLDADLQLNSATSDSNQTFASHKEWQLELQGVSHQFTNSADDSTFVLGPLDLSIRQGEILYIVGGNGSGKTTLAMLLLGLYTPEQGTIFLNGVAVNSENMGAYRKHFSAVFADFHLFEQILGTDQEELGARASQYVNLLGLHHKVKVRDGRFSTLNLSTGQRKRLALVSAYLEDRQVYVFDEWAADQDPKFKRIFYTELLPELKARGKTVIVITHDDSYFDCADRIVKLDEGKLQFATETTGVVSPVALHLA
jgi:putative ATP-binding cassette transporter